ncbi:LrgB family protein [Algivirga pacifica]|uniref:LrgB family protein n=1 Tax=Algivirga pacifica TaxID=1162670 RepID=A0ABP9DCW9_9BACT
MSELLQSKWGAVLLTILVYLLFRKVQQHFRWALLNPILWSITVLAVVLYTLDVPYVAYEESAASISFLLSPSVVALGVLLYMKYPMFKGNIKPLVLALFIGSVVGVLSVVLLLFVLGVDEVLLVTLAPKSVTTPIAMKITTLLGGIPSLVAVVVILVGIFGAVVGPKLLQWAGVKNKVAIGLSLGAGAHGIGTAKALEIGILEGAAAGVAIGIMGGFTAFITPLIGAIFRLF